MTRRPNIFSYATSELSQDAFLCWLLEWSIASNKAFHPKLHECAEQFVKTLLALPDDTSFAVQKIKIFRQRFKIDVLVEINDEYVILIEDKVDTKFHSDQLSKYAKKVAQHYEMLDKKNKEKPHWKIKKHYLKSYLVWDDERAFVEREDYQVFDINDFTSFFGPYSTVDHDVFHDFWQNILRRQDRYEAYKSDPPNSWHPDTWNSFLYELRNKLVQKTSINGKFGSFHSGNTYWFLLTWLKDYKKDGSNVSLEFNSGHLVVKTHIKDPSSEKRKIREDLIIRLQTIYKGSNNVKFKIVGGKGKRLANSNSMIILEFTDYFKLDNGVIDFDESCRVIKEINTTFNTL